MIICVFEEVEFNHFTTIVYNFFIIVIIIF